MILISISLFQQPVNSAFIPSFILHCHFHKLTFFLFFLFCFFKFFRHFLSAFHTCFLLFFFFFFCRHCVIIFLGQPSKSLFQNIFILFLLQSLIFHFRNLFYAATIPQILIPFPCPSFQTMLPIRDFSPALSSIKLFGVFFWGGCYLFFYICPTLTTFSPVFSPPVIPLYNTLQGKLILCVQPESFFLI